MDGRSIASDNYVASKLLKVSLVSKKWRTTKPKQNEGDQQDERPIVDHVDAGIERKDAPGGGRGKCCKAEKGGPKVIRVENYISGYGQGVDYACCTVA